MAKKIKKTKITETLVTQLQETPIVEETPVVEEQEISVVEEEEKEEPKPEPKPVKLTPQKSKFYDKVKTSKTDSETAGINFGLTGSFL